MEKKNLYRLYYLLIDSVSQKTLMQIDEVEMKDLIKSVNMYLNEKKHEIAKLMKIDRDFSTWELIRAVKLEQLKDVLEYDRSDVWGDDVGVRCLSIMARFYPLMITNLDQKDYRRLVIALILSNQCDDDNYLDYMVDVADLKDGNSESMAFLAAQICYLGVNDIGFCGWIVKNWASCSKYKKQILKKLGNPKHHRGAQQTLYLLCANPLRRFWDCFR